jgi:hypothetical protein
MIIVFPDKIRAAHFSGDFHLQFLKELLLLFFGHRITPLSRVALVLCEISSWIMDATSALSFLADLTGRISLKCQILIL